MQIQQRITTVEKTVLLHGERLTVVEAAQTDLKAIVARLTDMASEHGKSLALNDAATVAIRERTDILADNMEKITERLTEKQEKNQEKNDDRLGKVESRLDKQETRWGFLQAIGVASAGVILTIIIQRVAELIH